MKLVNVGRGEGGEKAAFSFKKCSAFQFVKRKVRRWMRNPKVSVEKAPGKCLLYPCAKCPLAEELWYPHYPSPCSLYGCCHYVGPPYYAGPTHRSHPEPSARPSESCDKGKGCKVRKWKMLSQHPHGKAKDSDVAEEAQPGCCRRRGPPAYPAGPVVLECAVCSGPYVGYAPDDAWQPRQRTQAMDLYYHNESDPDNYCCPGDNGESTASIRAVLSLLPPPRLSGQNYLKKLARVVIQTSNVSTVQLTTTPPWYLTVNTLKG
ncbi:uncharacterized protein LOC133496981 [Syngnathoides biaculeatus]|uniref:uncharacterized protein LOC133496981 n=1 Tax=Syngnathoides biaculeatus TaxID=300417 RepID=UPI002ADDF601|nr:uncharacterized protein LOC133496981 [Syngnathoides biaculeatus]